MNETYTLKELTDVLGVDSLFAKLLAFPGRSPETVTHLKQGSFTFDEATGLATKVEMSEETRHEMEKYGLRLR